MSQELQYLLAVIGLFIVPRMLQRLRVPTAITCLAIGAGLGMGMNAFHGDTTVPLLATLGIVALFLFAGLEVDIDELVHGAKVTLGHLVMQGLLLGSATWVLGSLFHLDWRPSLLFALALFTPSAGFILDSLPGFGLTEQQQYWVKTKAIASELVALGALFIVVQSSSVTSLGLSSLALAAMVAALPVIFKVFASRMLPYAPKSEFAFVLILALTCAYLTRHLGVYYLVGAFLVGVTAVRLRQRLPELVNEKMLTGIELFASFFIPFYFFKAGLHLEKRYFVADAVLLGGAFAAIAIPLRVGVVAAHRRFALDEPFRGGLSVGLSLVPTLVFTLVLADILHERYAFPDHLYGSLIVFTLLNTILPGLILKAAPPEFVAPEIPRSPTIPPPAHA
ncbi:MAG: cation:proton antiporter [Polyangiaceae bacterium]|nr:cation:proton antiporter [Polyangiaceae bacterium]